MTVTRLIPNSVDTIEQDQEIKREQRPTIPTSDFNYDYELHKKDRRHNFGLRIKLQREHLAQMKLYATQLYTEACMAEFQITMMEKDHDYRP